MRSFVDLSSLAHRIVAEISSQAENILHKQLGELNYTVYCLLASERVASEQGMCYDQIECNSLIIFCFENNFFAPSSIIFAVFSYYSL